MIVTPGVVDTLRARSKAITTMRRMLEDQGERGRAVGGEGRQGGRRWAEWRWPAVTARGGDDERGG